MTATVTKTTHPDVPRPPLQVVPIPAGIPEPKMGEPRVQGLLRFAISITVLNILGHLFLGFEQPPIVPFATVALAYAMELGLEALDARLTRRPARFGRSPKSVMVFLLPAHITALACGMLLYSGPVLWPVLLATASAVTVKYLIKAPVAGKMRHVMNPSNFGIALVLVLFPWVGIAPPYMFTAHVQQPFDWIIPLGVLMLGTMLNVKLTKKWPLILAWLGGWIVQAAARSVLTGSDFVAALGPLTGVAFILFTNYMITDPGSTPFKKQGQIAFGFGCALMYGILMTLDIAYGLFFALVLTCLVRAALLWSKDLMARLR